MPITGLSADTCKLHETSFHGRNGSDELDVFEAARYFSGCNEASGHTNGATYTQKIMRDHSYRHSCRGGRMSLDLPLTNPLPAQQNHHAVEKPILKEKKFKQPSSPGGRLASFLNSLFNQTSSKKKKPKSAVQSIKDIDDEEIPGGRRRRRSSISHFRSSATADTKSIYSSSSSGFRTPPPYANTPTKSYKDFTNYSGDKQAINSLEKQNGNAISTGFANQVSDERRKPDLSWLEERIIIRDGNHRYSDRDRNWVDQHPSEEREFRQFSEEDDGGESDSSSDLFELQNYDLGIYSSDLPVYETTQMDSIKG